MVGFVDFYKNKSKKCLKQTKLQLISINDGFEFKSKGLATSNFNDFIFQVLSFDWLRH